MAEGSINLVSEIQDAKQWLQEQTLNMDRLQIHHAALDKVDSQHRTKAIEENISRRKSRVEWLIDCAQTSVFSQDYTDPQLDLELAGLEYQWSYLKDKLLRLHRHQRSKTDKVSFVYTHKKLPVSRLHRTFPVQRERQLSVNLEHGKAALRTKGRTHVTKLCIPYRVHIKGKVKKHPRSSSSNSRSSSCAGSVASYDTCTTSGSYIDQSEPPCATSSPLPQPVTNLRKLKNKFPHSRRDLVMEANQTDDKGGGSGEKSFHLFMAASRGTSSGLSPTTSFAESPALLRRKRTDSENADYSLNTSTSVSLNSPCLSPSSPHRPVNLNRLSMCSDSDSYMSSPQASPGIGLRKKKDVKGHYKKDELWQAIQSDYQYLMDDEIIETCKSTESDLSMEDDDIGNSKVTFSDFIQQYKELTDWLNQIQLVTKRQGASLSEKYLNQTYYEEMLQRSPRRKLFNDYAKQLMRRYPNMKEEIHIRLQHLNNQWAALETAISPCGGVNDEDTMLRDLEQDLNGLRSWLHVVEGRLLPLCLRSTWSLQELEDKLKNHQELQGDIESHSKVVSSVLKLCERLQHDNRACDSEDDREALQLVAINLERRWHAIWLQSLEWQCRLEEAINRRKGLTTIGSARSSWSDLTYKTANSRERDLDHNHDVGDSERSDYNDTYDDDTGSDEFAVSDVIPFSDHEYEKIPGSMNGSQEAILDDGVDGAHEQDRMENYLLEGSFDLKSQNLPEHLTSTPKVDRTKMGIDSKQRQQKGNEKLEMIQSDRQTFTELTSKVSHYVQSRTETQAYLIQQNSNRVESGDVGYSSGSPSNEEIDHMALSLTPKSPNGTSLEVHPNDSVFTNVSSLSPSNFSWEKSSHRSESDRSTSTLEKSPVHLTASPELTPSYGEEDDLAKDLDNEVSNYHAIISSPSKNFYKMTLLDSELINPVDKTEEGKVTEALENIIENHSRVETKLDSSSITVVTKTHLDTFDDEILDSVETKKADTNFTESSPYSHLETSAMLNSSAFSEDISILHPGDEIVIRASDAQQISDEDVGVNMNNSNLVENNKITITTSSFCDSTTENDSKSHRRSPHKPHHVPTGFGVIEPVVSSLMTGPGVVGDDSGISYTVKVDSVSYDADESSQLPDLPRVEIPPCASCHTDTPLSQEDYASSTEVTDLKKGFESVSEAVIATPGGDTIYVEVSSRSTSVERDSDICDFEEEFRTSKIMINDSRSSCEREIDIDESSKEKSKITITHSSRPLSEAPIELQTSQVTVNVDETVDLQIESDIALKEEKSETLTTIYRSDDVISSLESLEPEDVISSLESLDKITIKVLPRHSNTRHNTFCKDKKTYTSALSTDPVTDWVGRLEISDPPVTQNGDLCANSMENGIDVVIGTDSRTESIDERDLNTSQSRLDYIAQDLDYRLERHECLGTTNTMTLQSSGNGEHATCTESGFVTGDVDPVHTTHRESELATADVDSMYTTHTKSELATAYVDPAKPGSENIITTKSHAIETHTSMQHVLHQAAMLVKEEELSHVGPSKWLSSGDEVDDGAGRPSAYMRSTTKSSIHSDMSTDISAQSDVDDDGSCDASSEYTSESEDEDHYCSVIKLDRQLSGDLPQGQDASQPLRECLPPAETVSIQTTTMSQRNQYLVDSSRETTPEVVRGKPTFKQRSRKISAGTDQREKTPSDENTVVSSGGDTENIGCEEEVDEWLESIDVEQIDDVSGSDDTDELLTSTLESFSENAWDSYQAPPYSNISMDDEEERLDDSNLQWDDEYQFKDSGVYSGGFSKKHQSPKEVGNSPSAVYAGDSSKLDDSDSDLEDLHHVISETTNAMKITETSLKRRRKDDLGLGISLDPSIYAEHVATCQTNIKCLELICEQLESEQGLPNLTDVDLLEIEDTIEKWTVLHKLAMERQLQSQQLRQVYKEILDVRRSLRDVENEISEDTFDGFLDLERSIKFLQDSKMQFTIVNSKLNKTSETIQTFAKENSAFRLTKLYEEIRKLTMHWQIIIERTNTRIGELQLILLSWYDFNETQKEMAYLLKQERRQLCLTELSLEIMSLSIRDRCDTHYDLEMMMSDLQLYELKLKTLRQEADTLCAVMSEDTRQQITVQLSGRGNELESVRLKCHNLMEALGDGVVINTKNTPLTAGPGSQSNLKGDTGCDGHVLDVSRDYKCGQGMEEGIIKVGSEPLNIEGTIMKEGNMSKTNTGPTLTMNIDQQEMTPADPSVGVLSLDELDATRTSLELSESGGVAAFGEMISHDNAECVVGGGLLEGNTGLLPEASCEKAETAQVEAIYIERSARRRNLCARVCCMALPLQILFVLLIAFGLLLTPDCCEMWDTYSLEWTPRLRYVNGAPPV